MVGTYLAMRDREMDNMNGTKFIGTRWNSFLDRNGIEDLSSD